MTPPLRATRLASSERSVPTAMTLTRSSHRIINDVSSVAIHRRSLPRGSSSPVSGARLVVKALAEFHSDGHLPRFNAETGLNTLTTFCKSCSRIKLWRLCVTRAPCGIFNTSVLSLQSVRRDRIDIMHALAPSTSSHLGSCALSLTRSLSLSLGSRGWTRCHWRRRRHTCCVANPLCCRWQRWQAWRSRPPALNCRYCFPVRTATYRPGRCRCQSPRRTCCVPSCSCSPWSEPTVWMHWPPRPSTGWSAPGPTTAHRSVASRHCTRVSRGTAYGS